ncbi:MAG: response regulator [Candidatus Obscuribacterales bacterium]
MKNATVLLVDDNADLRKLVSKTLTSLCNWHVETAGSGLEALSFLEKQKPDLILMDVSMPQMDGLTAIEEIKKRKEWRGIPIILITARVQNHEMNQYRHLAIAGVISKPFDPMKLPNQINRLIEQWSPSGENLRVAISE